MGTRREKELLTPYKISVTLLIEKYGTLRPKYWGSDSENDLSLFCNRGPSLPPRERKATCILISNLIQGSDINLSELIEFVESSAISTVHTTSFISGLQELYRNGIESLLSLFDSVEKFCVQDQSRNEMYPCLWTSLVGLNLRQLNLVFRRLSFSNVISLYQKYQAYYENCYKNRPSMLEDISIHPQSKENVPLVRSYELSNVSGKDETNENDIDMDETSLNINSSFSSRSETPRLPLKEKEEVQLRFSLPSDPKTDNIGNNANPSLKTRQQAELFIQEQICLLLQQDPSAMPPAQLQQILSTICRNCPDLGKGHFLSYLNCLRVREHTSAMHSLVRAYDSKLMHKDIARGEDITRTFRYAALNMAALHSQFGHRDLALTSLEEAIRIGQDSNDHVCLQYALAWLYSLSDSQKLTLMRRSHIRSGEMNLSYLSWISLLNYTIELSKSKIPPSHILKKLLGPLSPSNHNQNALEGGLGGQSGLWSVQAGLWSMWGNIHLTAMCSQLVLHMVPQMATSLHTPSTASPTCAALCNMALILANLGEFTLSGEVLCHAQEQFPSPWEHSKLWMFTQCFIAFYESLRQGLWAQAKTFAVNMATVNPTYSKLLEAELLVARGEFSQALNITTQLTELETVHRKDFAKVSGHSVDPEIQVKAILTEAEALAGGNNIGGALSTLVKGIQVAREYHMAYLAALGHLHMACMQMHLGLLEEANVSIERGMDVILSGGGVYDQARARLLQAKLGVCCSKKSNYNDKLMDAAMSLEETQKLFVQVKALQREKETVYLKARFYHACGKIEERNRSALEFRQLELQHPSQIIIINTCIF